MDQGRAGKAQEDVAAAYFNASLAEEFPESYGVGDLGRIVAQIDEAEAAADDAMRDDFARLAPAEQSRMLDLLAASGFKDRQWWEALLGCGINKEGNEPNF